MEEEKNIQVIESADEVQPIVVTTARCLDSLKLALLVRDLSRADDAIRALQMIDDYFQSQKGATALSIDGSKEFVNTTDESLLFPQLELACRDEIAKIRQECQGHAAHYLDTYIERWRSGAGGWWLPAEFKGYSTELDTERARKYFLIAIDEKVIKRTPTGYTKENGITWAQIAYFLKRVYTPNGSTRAFPDKPLSILFGHNRLSAAIDKLSCNSKTGGGGKPRGYETIDGLFED